MFLGNFAVDESDGPTPLRVQKDWKFLTVSIILCSQQHSVQLSVLSFFLSLQLPIIMLVAFSMCIVCLLMAGKIFSARHITFSTAEDLLCEQSFKTTGLFVIQEVLSVVVA